MDANLPYRKLICFLFSLVTLVSRSESTWTTSIEGTLRTTLDTNYRPEIRPDATTTISLLYTLTSINVVDIKNQEFGVAGWWSVTWNDSRLSWTPSSHSNIPVLQLADDKLWRPCLVVANSVNDLSAFDEETIPLRVDYGGVVHWAPPGLHKVSCDMDITYFPFDEHWCYLEVTSFGYSIEEVNIYVNGDGLNLDYYSANGEWDLTGTSSDRSIYENDGYNYSKVEFHVKMKRQPLYFGLNYLLPTFVTSVLTAFVFVLPAESGEKIGHCLTVLLQYTVVLTMTAEQLPTTATTTSILQVYIAFVLILSCFSVILSIMILNFYFRPAEEKVHKTLRKITIVAVRVSCFKRRKSRIQPGDFFFTTDDHLLSNDHPSRRENSGTGTKDQAKKDPPAEKALDESEVSWQIVSQVLDAIMFKIFIITIVVSSLLILIIFAAQ